MELILAGAGMLGCLVLMMLVMPLGRRFIGWARSGGTEEGPTDGGEEGR